MYGILLESVQEYIIQECGEEIWQTILRESGAKNTVFNTHQLYPDTLMLRLASALARLVSKDPSSPTVSIPPTPVPKKKSSIKKRSSLRSCPVRPRTQSAKCPFTSAAAIKEITKQHIASYHSSEEIYKQVDQKIDTPFMVEYLNNVANATKNAKEQREEIKNMFKSISAADKTMTMEQSALLSTKENDAGALLKNRSFGGKVAFDRRNSELKNNSGVSIAEDIDEDQSVSDSTDFINICIKSEDDHTVVLKELIISESDPSEPSSLISPTTSGNKDKTGSIITSSISKMSRSESGGLEMSRRSSGFSGTFADRRNSSGVNQQVLVRSDSSELSETVLGRRDSATVKQAATAHGPDCKCAEKKAAELKAKFGTPEKVMYFFGRCFVKYFSRVGYDTFIRATGRYFCTFLQSVDNIHQRMRFTFPHMRSPTMQLVRAHRHGAELIYSSTRHGFAHYLMGQLYEIAEDKFKLKLNVSIVRETTEGAYSVVVLRLEFDNSDYVQSLLMRKARPCPLPAVPVSVLLQLFPFGVLFDRKMKVLMAGDKLVQVWGGPHTAVRKCLASEILRLRKPKTTFTWDKVVSMQSVIFELELVRFGTALSGGNAAGEARRGSQGVRLVLLKGQMRLLEEIDAIIYLCSPIFNDLEELNNAGLYLADLNGHGLSRQLLLTGWQHCSKLELLFEKAEGRSATLEKSHRLRDAWKKKGDQLLYSMIPKPIVDHLRLGKDPPRPEAFDSVTIIFCAVALEETGSRAGVMHTVANINAVYSKIDRILDSHRVYKVETVGSVYMVVSGAPERSRSHAAAAASAALEVSRALPALTLGIHSGPCVAGVLGLRLPRYCLVGDTVNTASRMQTTSEPGRIHVSAATAALLHPGRFRLRPRGLIKVKGKGTMETFWLEGEVEEDDDQEDALHMFSQLCEENHGDAQSPS